MGSNLPFCRRATFVGTGRRMSPVEPACCGRDGLDTAAERIDDRGIARGDRQRGPLGRGVAGYGGPRPVSPRSDSATPAGDCRSRCRGPRRSSAAARPRGRDDDVGHGHHRAVLAGPVEHPGPGGGIRRGVPGSPPQARGGRRVHHAGLDRIGGQPEAAPVQQLRRLQIPPGRDGGVQRVGGGRADRDPDADAVERPHGQAGRFPGTDIDHVRARVGAPLDREGSDRERIDLPRPRVRSAARSRRRCPGNASAGRRRSVYQVPPHGGADVGALAATVNRDRRHPAGYTGMAVSLAQADAGRTERVPLRTARRRGIRGPGVPSGAVSGTRLARGPRRQRPQMSAGADRAVRVGPRAGEPGLAAGQLIARPVRRLDAVALSWSSAVTGVPLWSSRPTLPRPGFLRRP